MRRVALPRFQRGVTLVVGLIMLVLITLIVTAAFILSGSNLQSVGNMQFRDEAIAAANAAIEDRMSSTFTTAPATTTYNADINNDGITDDVVTLTPTCIRATVAVTTPPSSQSLAPAIVSISDWNTVWDIDATVANVTTGASIHMHSGVNVLLHQAQKDVACP
jgi:Tfp pilus assembly protein PilX